jgi:hypothetical protein
MSARLSLVLALTCALSLGAAGCGIANGLGMANPLHADRVAFCRYCADRGEVCIEDERGEDACAPFEALMGCDAAQSLFFTHEEGGSYLSYEGGKGQLGKGFARDCPDGQQAYVAEVLVYDAEYDPQVGTSWDSATSSSQARGDDVMLVDADQRPPYKPTKWDTQALYSTLQDTAVYAVEIVFCTQVVFTEPVALQVRDKAGNHSNAVCLDPP